MINLAYMTLFSLLISTLLLATVASYQPPITITSTPTPSVTATPQISWTPLPPVIWTDGIQPVATLPNKVGAYWSPTANEVIFDNCHLYLNQAKQVTLASAPDFLPQKITPDTYDCMLVGDFNMIWSPDGQQIVYSGPPPINDDNLYFRAKDIWLMERDGSQARPINHGATTSRNLAFLGWMDKKTLVYKVHSGTGVISSIIDVTTGYHLATLDMDARLHHFLPPNHQYMVGGNCLPICKVRAMPRTTQPALNRWDVMKPDDIILLTATREIGAYPEDWRPNTNQLLIKIFDPQEEPDSLTAQLALWDIETMTIAPLIPQAVKGVFSPDGRTLLYITLTIDPLSESAHPLDTDDDTPYTNYVPHIHLFDMTTQQDIFQAPIITNIKDWYNPYIVFNNALLTTISPNSEYATFIMATPFTLTEAYSSTRSSNVEISPSLHIFNIKNKSLAYSTPTDLTAPLWSPTSDKLIYRDSQHNLVLLDVQQMITTSLTSQGGARISRPQWSFNGRYVTVKSYNKVRQTYDDLLLDDGDLNIMIFDIALLPQQD